MELTSLLVDDSTVPADLQGLAAVALVGRHELDTAVAVPLVVPLHERRHPQAGFLSAGKRPSWVLRPVFRCSEQGFGVRVVVRHPWPGEGPQDSQLLQPGFQRGRPHSVAVVGMLDQRLFAPLADPLADAGPTDQIGCDGWVFSFGDIPGLHLAAAHVDHEVEIQLHPSHGGG